MKKTERIYIKREDKIIDCTGNWPLAEIPLKRSTRMDYASNISSTSKVDNASTLDVPVADA